MKIFVVANVEQQEEILLKNTNAGAEIIFGKTYNEPGIEKYDAFFILDKGMKDEGLKNFTTKPVFINSVIETLQENNLPINFSRLNAWPGFLQRPLWEIASNDKPSASKVLEFIGWQFVFVKDEPGLVAARVISMIINEAFYALGENISTAEEIDLAMKLGTNYPFGPFEWQQKMGLQPVHDLLQKLSVTDKRYLAAPSLLKKYSELIFAS